MAFEYHVVFFSSNAGGEPTDTIAPVVSGCPTGVVVNAPAGATSSQAFWTEPSATDNSGSVNVVQSHTPGSQFLAGTTVVSYTFSDAAGNSASCSFEVVVNSEYCCIGIGTIPSPEGT